MLCAVHSAALWADCNSRHALRARPSPAIAGVPLPSPRGRGAGHAGSCGPPSLWAGRGGGGGPSGLTGASRSSFSGPPRRGSAFRLGASGKGDVSGESSRRARGPRPPFAVWRRPTGLPPTSTCPRVLGTAGGAKRDAGSPPGASGRAGDLLLRHRTATAAAPPRPRPPRPSGARGPPFYWPPYLSIIAALAFHWLTERQSAQSPRPRPPRGRSAL